MALVVELIIILLVIGFILWAARKLIAVVPLDPFFRQVIDVVLIIVVVAIVLFYVVIPILHILAGVRLESLVH